MKGEDHILVRRVISDPEMMRTLKGDNLFPQVIRAEVLDGLNLVWSVGWLYHGSLCQLVGGNLTQSPSKHFGSSIALVCWHCIVLEVLVLGGASFIILNIGWKVVGPYLGVERTD